MNTRNSAKGIIHHDNNLLLTKNQDDEGYFYLFPGGGQDHGEALNDAVKRECLEETGYVVDIGPLVFVRDYIGKNHEHASFDHSVHQVEFYFLCKLENTLKAAQPVEPDEHQVGIEWITLDKLESLRIYPKAIVPILLNRLKNQATSVYLGDIN